MNAITHALNAALLHFLWQGAAVAFVLWIGLFLLRGRSAQSRYLAACAALAAMAIFPLLTAFAVYEAPAPSQPASAVYAFLPAPASPAADGSLQLPRLWLAALQTWALPVWTFGVLLLSVRLVWGCRQLARMRRRGGAPDDSLRARVSHLANRLGLPRHVAVLIAAQGESPSVAGWLRPVVLVPSAALLGLTADQLEAVLAHELAHIRRHDYLLNVFQILIETLLFYHPAIWWVSACIRHERELCCDDLAVRCCGDRVCYARALTVLERLRLAAPEMAMGSNSGPVLYRIQRLLGAAPRECSPSKLPAILALAVAAACFVVNVHWARAQEPQQAKKPGVFFFSRSDQTDDPGVAVDAGGATLVNRSRIEYPGWAIERKLQGTITAELTLNADGNVMDARIVSGPPELRRFVLQSVLEWSFAKPYANAVLQVRVTFDQAAAAAAGQRSWFVNDGRGRGYAVTTRDQSAVTPQQQEEQTKRALVELRAQMAKLEDERQGQFTDQQRAEADAAARQARVELSQLEKDAAQQRFLRDQALTMRQADQTTEFLRQELETARAQSATSQERLSELERQLAVAEAAQNLTRIQPDADVAGLRLARINVVNLPESSVKEVVARLGVHVGDTLTAQSADAITAALKQFDPTLQVFIGVDANHDAQILIAGPESGLRRRPKQ